LPCQPPDGQALPVDAMTMSHQEQPDGPRAEVVPLGNVNEVACAVAAAHLRMLMGLRSKVVNPEPLPDSAYLKLRGQHNAAVITDHLARDLPPGVIRVGVTEYDLCLPVFTHVFGEARMGGGVAVSSLYHLRRGAEGEPAPRDLLYQRLAKVVCHEAGHAMGLSHCLELGCLMRFAGELSKLDALQMWFCPACDQELGRRRAMFQTMSRSGA
jgi:archaemetzincin